MVSGLPVISFCRKVTMRVIRARNSTTRFIVLCVTHFCGSVEETETLIRTFNKNDFEIYLSNFSNRHYVSVVEEEQKRIYVFFRHQTVSTK